MTIDTLLVACTVEDCSKQVSCYAGGCPSCERTWCEDHKVCKEHHPCMSLSDRERWIADDRAREGALERTLDLIRQNDFAHEAQLLRPGHTCTADLPQSVEDLIHGGSNVLVPLSWDDGEEWMARVRLKHARLPPSRWMRIVLRSEYETIKYMHEAGLKVPNVFLPADWDSGNSPLDYFFMTRVPGSPVRLAMLSDTQRANFIHDFAHYHIGLSKLRFSGVGSLHPDPSANTPILGPLAWYPRMLEDPPYFQGPYASPAEFMLPTLDSMLQAILDGTVVYRDPIRMYLARLELRDILLHDKDMGITETETYICQADQNPDQFFVDEEGHLTGVIDWEWSYTSHKQAVFSTPSWFSGVRCATLGEYDKPSINEDLLVEDYEKAGRSDLAECVRRGRKWQLLVLQTSSSCTEDQITGRIVGLTELARGSEESGGWPGAWLRIAKGRFKDDEGLRILEARRSTAQS